MAVEINYKIQHGHLAMELVSKHLLLFDFIPKQDFRKGAVFAEFPRFCLQLFSVGDDVVLAQSAVA